MITKTYRNETYDADGNLVATEVVEVDVTEETNRTTIEDRLDQAIPAMQAHIARGTFTTAQRDAALLLALRVLVGMAKILRRSLQTAD